MFRKMVTTYKIDITAAIYDNHKFQWEYSIAKDNNFLECSTHGKSALLPLPKVEDYLKRVNLFINSAINDTNSFIDEITINVNLANSSNNISLKESNVSQKEAMALIESVQEQILSEINQTKKSRCVML